MYNKQTWLADTPAFNELMSVHNVSRETASDYVVSARMSANHAEIEDPVCYISANIPGLISKPISRKTAELVSGVVKTEYFSI